jgi:predicted branched-subunit amino acid permease
VTSRVSTAVGMGLREFRRMPVLLGLLLFLPAYFVGIFVLLVPDTTVPIPLDGGAVAVAMPAFAAVFMTAVAVAILSGVVGLFL